MYRVLFHKKKKKKKKKVHAVDLHEHIGGTLSIYEGVGHGFVVQAHEKFNKELEEFTRKADKEFLEKENQTNDNSKGLEKASSSSSNRTVVSRDGNVLKVKVKSRRRSVRNGGARATDDNEDDDEGDEDDEGDKSSDDKGGDSTKTAESLKASSNE